MARAAAAPIIRTTYALDAETVARLDRLAKNWNLSRSAALRRLICEAPAMPQPAAASDPRLEALNRLQASNTRSREETDNWLREVGKMRQASTRRTLQKLRTSR
ncbi:MAG: ribbon-helix-helix protein, CopG family [Terriglobales bacterium]